MHLRQINNAFSQDSGHTRTQMGRASGLGSHQKNEACSTKVVWRRAERSKPAVGIDPTYNALIIYTNHSEYFTIHSGGEVDVQHRSMNNI